MGVVDNVRILRDRAERSGAQDALLSALVDKLPEAGTNWPAADREAWLSMARQAFDVVYGTTKAAPVKANSRPARRPPPKKKAARPKVRPPRPLGDTGPMFFIDRQGYARRRGGDRIMPDQVLDHLVDLRGERGDLAAIVWADDSAGIPRGVQLDITIG